MKRGSHDSSIALDTTQKPGPLPGKALTGQDLRQRGPRRGEFLGLAGDLREGNADELVLAHTHIAVAFAGEQPADCGRTEHGGEHAIVRCRRASPLRMTQDADLGGVTALLEICRQFVRQSGHRTFRYDDDARRLAAFYASLDRGNHSIDALVLLGNQDGLRSASETGLHGDESGAMSHDFDQERAIMGTRGIANPVDRLNRGVDRCIESDRIVRSGDVVVDRARKADGWEPGLTLQCMRSGEGSVASDDDKAVDILAPKEVGRFLAYALLEERLTAIGLKNGTAALNDISHRVGGQRLDLALE